MFTVCPKCSLTLVVTAADLRVAQGYVRCGRCSNVFNATVALSEEKQAAAAAEALEFDPTATKVEDVFVESALGDDETTGTYEAIVLESGEDDPTSPDEELAPDADAELEYELQSLAERIEAQTQERPQLVVPAAAPSVAVEGFVIEGEEPPPEKIWPWRLGTAALVLAFALQAVHHYRHDLAVVPQLNAPLTRIYHALGVSLMPRWDAAAYEVHQLGAASDTANNDRLIVRASLKNAAAQPQPLPILRVAVQDRYGNRIAARDVLPLSYAPRAPNALLASGQRFDVEINFVDPGEQAVGFEIDACLPAPGGGVNCANHYN